MGQGCLVVLLVLVLAFALQLANGEVLNVHVIAHTHDDVGWLKTVDEYFYGANNSIQDARVQYILDTVVQALQMNPERRFIYVEIAFFYRWWREQTDQMKTVVRNLVSSGQLEFINAGWCMNDEGGVNYEATIDQMTKGHQFLQEEFGLTPKIGWQVDPFGHASNHAALLAQMGFDALFLYRIDYQDWLQRNATQNLEFIWQATRSLGEKTELFTHVLDLNDGYCAIPGFNWDSTSTASQPVMDDPNLENYNIDQFAVAFTDALKIRGASFKHNHLLYPFGCDFEFANAFINFKNMDKMINYINSHPELGVNISYSTPSRYLAAVNALNLQWSTKEDDFFPYSQFPHAYWSGYFTSRQALKGYIRSRNPLLHAAQKLLAVAAPAKLISAQQIAQGQANIDIMTDGLSITQHHDSISGTAKQHVTDDYALRLSQGSDACYEVIGNVLQEYTGLAQTFCPLLNESTCPALQNLATNGAQVAVTLYNVLGWDRAEVFILNALPTAAVTVTAPNGQVIDTQVLPNKDDSTLYDLAFIVDVPAMGYSTYIVKNVFNAKPTYISEVQRFTKMSQPLVVSNDQLQLVFSSDTNLLMSITAFSSDSSSANLSAAVAQNIFWYNASAGYNAPNDGTRGAFQASGAYMLRVNSTDVIAIGEGSPSIEVHSGPLVIEVRQSWTAWASQVVRLMFGNDYFELETTIGPIDISDDNGKEVFTRFGTSLSTNSTWYSDSEGGEMQKRVLNQRSSFTVNVTEPIGGNYYPMNEIAFITDPQTGLKLSILTDRTRGVSSQADGSLETMLHRRLLYDDHQGVGEALNESNVVRSKQWVRLSSTSDSENLWRADRYNALQLNNPLLPAFSTLSSNSPALLQYAPIAGHLPDDVHLQSLVLQSNGSVLLRLHHTVPSEEGGVDESVSLNNLFANLTVISVNELGLTGLPLSQATQRMTWAVHGRTSSSAVKKRQDLLPGDWTVTLAPLETRTFLLDVVSAS